MPIPVPNSGEEKKDFIQRCMSDSKMISEYENTDQRLAVCSISYEENLSKVKLESYKFTKNTNYGKSRKTKKLK